MARLRKRGASPTLPSLLLTGGTTLFLIERRCCSSGQKSTLRSGARIGSCRNVKLSPSTSVGVWHTLGTVQTAVSLSGEGGQLMKRRLSSQSLTLLRRSGGVYNKAQIVKLAATDCEVKSYSLDNFKFVMLDKNAALITYTGMQDAVCSGKTIPAIVRGSSVYVKRGGKWLNALYMETPVTQ